MTNQNQPQTTPLTQSAVAEIAGAIQRLNELSTIVVRTREMDEEAAALNSYVSAQMTMHAAEFINAWLTIFEEYQPLVRSFASLQQRAANYSVKRQQWIAEQVARTQKPASENIISASGEFKK